VAVVAFSGRHQIQEASTAPREPTNVVLQRSKPKNQENRKLALMLASVAVTVFVMVVILGVLFHYAEVHHSLPMLSGLFTNG
jgi:hypothetical protein